MRIFFDLGNTCIKWSVEGAPGEAGRIQYEDAPHFLSELLEDIDAAQLQVLVASVVKDGRYDGFLAQLRGHGITSVHVCVVTSSAVGVRCGYRDVSRLGIDRWLAVVAGWHLVKTSFVVMDLGTAATIDFVDADGRHLGGYILPGLRLGVAGLLRGTSNVQVDFDKLDARDLSPGSTTTEAVYHGAIFAMKAVAEQAIRSHRARYPDAKLLITGGDADIVATVLECDCLQQKDLVFAGMRLLADAGLVVEPTAREDS